MDDLNTSVPQEVTDTVVQDNFINTESTEQDTTGDVEPKQQPQQNTEVDYSPFLKAISEKAKYNHGPVQLESIDQVIENVQKGLNYDKVYEKFNQLQQDPRLSFVENLANEYNMHPEEYIQAVYNQLEQQRINQLVQQNIPEYLAKEILETRKMREKLKNDEVRQQEEARKKEDYQNFLNEYPDIEPNTIPKDVWDMVANGKSLLDAYRYHENKTLKEQLAKVSQQEKAKQVNQQNAEISPGSVTGQGETDTGFFSKAQVESMSPSDVKRNYNKIMQSMKFWK